MSDGMCCACAYRGEEETACWARDDKQHCQCWYEGEAPAMTDHAQRAKDVEDYIQKEADRWLSSSQRSIAIVESLSLKALLRAVYTQAHAAGRRAGLDECKHLISLHHAPSHWYFQWLVKKIDAQLADLAKEGA